VTTPPVVTTPRTGFMVAAPLDATDPQIADLTTELARRTGFATGLPDGAQGRLTFYAQINGRRDAAGRIDVAAAGVDREFAGRLRFLFEMIRDAHLRGNPATPRIEIAVEPSDRVFASVPIAHRDAMLRAHTRALRVELPRLARVEARESYLSILADFLSQAATLPVGR
jgi:hypothetical protein